MTDAVGPSSADVLFRMVRLHALTRQKWKRSEGLSLVEYAVVEAIGTWPGLTPSVIAITLGLPRNLLSALLASLADAGLLTRLPDPQDARRVRLFLTTEGHRVRASCLKHWEKILQAMGEQS